MARKLVFDHLPEFGKLGAPIDEGVDDPVQCQHFAHPDMDNTNWRPERNPPGRGWPVRQARLVSAPAETANADQRGA
jgi:hypothetical protein